MKLVLRNRNKTTAGPAVARMSTPAVALALFAAGALSVGCAGAQHVDARHAPPPPSGGEHKIVRKVTKEAKHDFADAVAFYKQQEKLGWNAQRCTDAAQRFEQVASNHAKLVEARFDAGVAYQNCRMMKKAEEEYQQALKVDPANGASLANLGEIYFLAGNVSRAKQYWQQALQADQKTAAAHNDLAWLLIKQLRHTHNRAAFRQLENEAKGHLSRVLAVENGNIQAYVLYALLYMAGSSRNRARLDLAKLLLDEGAKHAKNYPPLYNARGLLLLKRKNVSQALAMFQKAVALDPNFIQARMNVGNITLAFRKYDTAKAQFTEVLKRQPKNYDALIGLGVAERGLKNIDAAEADYKKAMQLDPNRGEAYFNLGVLYKDFRANSQKDLPSSQKMYETARKYFHEYLTKQNLDPSNVREAKDNVGDCDKIVGQLAKIIRSMQKAKQQQQQEEQKQPKQPKQPASH